MAFSKLLTRASYNSRVSINNNVSKLLVPSRFVTDAQQNNKQNLEQAIFNYYGDPKTNKQYNDNWGEDNIHCGYFPHLAKKGSHQLNFREGAAELTKRMATLAGINNQSNVIEFGCGYGGAIKELSAMFNNCKFVGLDLTPEHIQHCTTKILPYLPNPKNVQFINGSFTDLPKEIRQRRFTHVFEQMAINHVQNYFETVVQQAGLILEKGGIIVWYDFHGCESKISQQTIDHFYKRLQLDFLLVPPSKYIEIITKNGFDVVNFEQLNDHCVYAYELLAESARKNKTVSQEDGKTLIADNYKKTADLMKNGEIGVNVVVAKKR